MDSEELLTRIRELELAAAQKSWPTWAKVACVVLALALIGAAGAAAYNWTHREKAQVMTELQIQQSAELAKRLDISQAQATKLAAELAKAKAENREPDIRYIVQAPTIERAAEQVRKDIDAGKSPANKIPADRTVVTPNTQQQKVDVYRITLDRARWGVSGLVLAGGSDAVEFGAGAAYHNKDWSISVGGTNRGRVFVMGTKYF